MNAGDLPCSTTSAQLDLGSTHIIYIPCNPPQPGSKKGTAELSGLF